MNTNIEGIRLGVIGYGARGSYIANTLVKQNPEAAIVAIADFRIDDIKEQLKADGSVPDSVNFYSDVDGMLDKEELDGVIVSTRCSLHTPMAIKVLQRNIPLFLEKPIATNMESLLALRKAGVETKAETVVSFPLRVTPIAQRAKEIIDSGLIGTVEHVQGFNNVPYGAVYFNNWYRDENETQGLWLQKATHDFDYINYILGIKPRWICAMKSKQVFKGDHPAGLKCVDCSERKTCLESLYNNKLDILSTVEPSAQMCCFAVDTGNEDSGSAIVEYESGMHVNYTQNFVARNTAAKRGATFIGYLGTLEFDWVKDELVVHMHHSHRTETHKFDSTKASHGGGDGVLVNNFVEVIRGESASIAPLDSGLLSVLMCLRAKESCETRTFQQVIYPDGLI